jgi:hypothetical protein
MLQLLSGGTVFQALARDKEIMQCNEHISSKWIKDNVQSFGHKLMETCHVEE